MLKKEAQKKREIVKQMLLMDLVMKWFPEDTKMNQLISDLILN